MGGKSSSRGDNGLAEQQRIKAEQDKAIARLNALFGVADPTQLVDKADFTTKKPLAVTLDGNRGGENSYFYQPKYEELFNQQGYDEAIKKVDSENAAIKAARDVLYQNVGNDVFNFKKLSLDKTRDDAARQLKFNLFRTGNVGGSNQINQNAELDYNYNRGLADLGNLRQSTINNAKANDESSRLDLIGRIRAGMNQADAVNSATEQQRSNLDKARDNALTQTVADYFGGMKYLQQQDQYQKDLNTGLKRFNVNPASYSGTIGRL